MNNRKKIKEVTPAIHKETKKHITEQGQGKASNTLYYVFKIFFMDGTWGFCRSTKEQHWGQLGQDVEYQVRVPRKSNNKPEYLGVLSLNKIQDEKFSSPNPDDLENLLMIASITAAINIELKLDHDIDFKDEEYLKRLARMATKLKPNYQKILNYIKAGV